MIPQGIICSECGEMMNLYQYDCGTNIATYWDKNGHKYKNKVSKRSKPWLKNFWVGLKKSDAIFAGRYTLYRQDIWQPLHRVTFVYSALKLITSTIYDHWRIYESIPVYHTVFIHNFVYILFIISLVVGWW